MRITSYFAIQCLYKVMYIWYVPIRREGLHAEGKIIAISISEKKGQKET